MRTVVAMLLLAGPALAGPYDLADPPQPIDFKALPRQVADLRDVPVPPKGRLDPASPRSRYLTRVEALWPKEQDGTLGTLDRVSLSACLIRLGELDKALLVLRKADQKHFLVQANMAAAHLMLGNTRDALGCQLQVLRLWPQTSALFPPDVPLPFLRQSELALLRLIESRERESRLDLKELPLDDVFRGFRVDGPKGYHEPGEVPQQVLDALPPNALAVMAQLLLWFPRDTRLAWQMGEMLAALGHVELGYGFIERIGFSTDMGSVFKNLHSHRKALQLLVKPYRELQTRGGQCGLGTLGLVMGMPALPSSPGGAAGQLVGAGWAVELAPELAKLDEWNKSQQGPGGLPPAPPAELPFNWKHVAVSFVFGALAALLLALQWWDCQRRAARQAEGLEGGAPPAADAPP